MISLSDKISSSNVYTRRLSVDNHALENRAGHSLLNSFTRQCLMKTVENRGTDVNFITSHHGRWHGECESISKRRGRINESAANAVP